MLRFLCILCLTASPLSAQDVQVLPGYSDFRMPDTTVHARPMTLMQDWIMEFPGTGEGRPAMEIVASLEDDRLVIEFTETGIADDSVSAIQRRMEFSPAEDRRWTLVAYGFRQKCWRGASDDWQATPCP